MTHTPPRIDREAMLADIAELVRIESPTEDLPGCALALAALSDLVQQHTGRTPMVRERQGRPYLHLRSTQDRRTTALLLGHIDTVWPLGTLARWPFAVDGDHASGPGVYDMKAGIVMGLHALSACADPAGVAMLITTDEETGSLCSRALIEEVARDAGAVLVLEPAMADGGIKEARKGVSLYRMVVTGRAAHAGLEPEKGINALLELAEQVRLLADLARPGLGTTVTPTVAQAGTTMNTVPARATVRIDVRAATTAELDRVAKGLSRVVAVLDGARVEVQHLGTRPPLEKDMSEGLVARYRQAMAWAGLAMPPVVTVGGGSDGNFTAGVGVPTLDGLGAPGDGAHAEGEHINVSRTVEATARLASLLDALT